MLSEQIMSKLSFYHFDSIELKFLDYIGETLRAHPFWWHLFINKIINDPKITYLKDTTMIISIYELTHNQVGIVYEILKSLLTIRAAKRIIKKKEFMIVHFHSIKVVEYLHNKTKWLAIPFLQLIKTYYPDYECFLDMTWNKCEEEIPVDIFLRHRNRSLFINVKQPIKYPLSQFNIKKAYLTRGDSLDQVLPSDYQIIKFRHDFPEFLKNVKTSFDLLAF